MRTLPAYLIAVCLAGCSGSKVSSGEYAEYVNDRSNGLIREVQAGDFSFMLQYRPQELETIREIEETGAAESSQEDGEPTCAEASVDNEMQMQYYLLRIGSADKRSDVMKLGLNNNGEMQDRMDYFNNRIIGDISLVDGKDTLPCLMHHWERTYQMTSYTTIMLAFEAKKEGNTFENKQLIFDDQDLGVGKIKIRIEGSDISSIPELAMLKP